MKQFYVLIYGPTGPFVLTDPLTGLLAVFLSPGEAFHAARGAGAKQYELCTLGTGKVYAVAPVDGR